MIAPMIPQLNHQLTNVALQSPGIDIIGVGLKSGEILLHNIKMDETLMRFYQDWGSVTSLSFRSGVPELCADLIMVKLLVWSCGTIFVFLLR